MRSDLSIVITLKMENDNQAKKSLPMRKIDETKINDGDFIFENKLYGKDGKVIGPIPYKEYPSEEEYRKELLEAGETSTEGLGSALSLNELLNTDFPEARFVVEQFFETGTMNMLSAPPNKFKSWIVILCAICVASGEDLFDKFKTEKQPVMIVNEEDTKRLLQERCNMLMKEIEPLPIYFHINKEIRIKEEFIDALIKEAQEKKVGLIIFDSLRSVHDADENSSQAMQEVMNQLKKITNHGITVLFTHHNRKKSRNGGNDEGGSEETRGSSVINASIQGHLAIEEVEREEGKYLVIYQPKLKAGAKIAPFEVKVTNDIENKKMTFVYEGEHKAREKILSQARSALFGVYEESKEWLSIKDLVALGIGGETTVRNANRMLEMEKLIQSKSRKEAGLARLPMRSQEGQHNEKVYFRITSQPEENEEDLSSFGF